MQCTFIYDQIILDELVNLVKQLLLSGLFCRSCCPLLSPAPPFCWSGRVSRCWPPSPLRLPSRCSSAETVRCQPNLFYFLIQKHFLWKNDDEVMKTVVFLVFFFFLRIMNLHKHWNFLCCLLCSDSIRHSESSRGVQHLLSNPECYPVQ